MCAPFFQNIDTRLGNLRLNPVWMEVVCDIVVDVILLNFALKVTEKKSCLYSLFSPWARWRRSMTTGVEVTSGLEYENVSRVMGKILFRILILILYLWEPDEKS